MPVITLNNPDGVAPPRAHYSHAVLVQGASRRLVMSGQVGKAPDETVPTDGAAQIALTFANLGAILSAHGMTATNVVKTTVFLTDRDLLAPFRAARDAFFAGHPAASTLLFVAGLADPRFVVEIEAEAVD